MNINQNSFALWSFWIMAVGGTTCVFLFLEIQVGIKRACRVPVLLCLTLLALLALPDTPFWLAGISRPNYLPDFSALRFNGDILEPGTHNLEFCDLHNDSHCVTLFQAIDQDDGTKALVHIGSEIPFATAYHRRGAEFRSSKGTVFMIQKCEDEANDKVLLGEECDGEFDALPNAAKWCRDTKRFYEIFNIWQWAVVSFVVLICWGAALTLDRNKKNDKAE